MRWSFTLPWLFAAGKPRKLGTYTFCPVAFALQAHLPQPVWSWLGVWGKLKSCSLFLLFPGPGLRRQADIIWMYGDLGCRFDITKHVIDTLQPCGLEALIMMPQEANHINGAHGVPSSPRLLPVAVTSHGLSRLFALSPCGLTKSQVHIR